jgi:hypothetical protein
MLAEFVPVAKLFKVEIERILPDKSESLIVAFELAAKSNETVTSEEAGLG